MGNSPPRPSLLSVLVCCSLRHILLLVDLSQIEVVPPRSVFFEGAITHLVQCRFPVCRVASPDLNKYAINPSMASVHCVPYSAHVYLVALA